MTRRVVEPYSLDAWHKRAAQAKGRRVGCSDLHQGGAEPAVKVLAWLFLALLLPLHLTVSSFKSQLSSMAWDAQLGLPTRSPWPVVWFESESKIAFTLDQLFVISKYLCLGLCTRSLLSSVLFAPGNTLGRSSAIPRMTSPRFAP